MSNDTKTLAALAALTALAEFANGDDVSNILLKFAEKCGKPGFDLVSCRTFLQTRPGANVPNHIVFMLLQMLDITSQTIRETNEMIQRY